MLGGLRGRLAVGLAAQGLACDLDGRELARAVGLGRGRPPRCSAAARLRRAHRHATASAAAAARCPGVVAAARRRRPARHRRCRLASPRRAAAGLACLRRGIGFLLGLGLGLGLLCEQRLPVGDRDLVVVGMDFVEGQEAVAVAAVVDEGGLQRRLYARDLGQIDIAAQELAGGRFVVELLYPAVAEHHDPGLLGMRGIDEHLVVLVHVMISCARRGAQSGRPDRRPTQREAPVLGRAILVVMLLWVSSTGTAQYRSAAIGRELGLMAGAGVISWSSKGRSVLIHVWAEPASVGQPRPASAPVAGKLLATWAASADRQSLLQAPPAARAARCLGTHLRQGPLGPALSSESVGRASFRSARISANFKRGRGAAFGGRTQRNAMRYYYEFARSEASTLNAVVANQIDGRPAPWPL